MSRFTMVLHECDGAVSEIGDPDLSFHDLAEARSTAIELARSIMAREVAEGRLCLSCWIVVKNEQGHAVMTLPFGDAIRLVDHPHCEAASAPDGPAEAAYAPSGISTGPTTSR